MHTDKVNYQLNHDLKMAKDIPNIAEKLVQMLKMLLFNVYVKYVFIISLYQPCSPY